MTEQPLVRQSATERLSLDELSARIVAQNCSLSACKEALSSGNDRIYEAYRDNISAAALVRLQTELTDTVILEIWHHLLGDSSAPLALLAVGGYGRSELHPHSDIDIGILTDGSLSDETGEQISLFITFLWDLGLDIGHSVRSVEQCAEEAAQDLTIITNLMEARHLAGSEYLFQQMTAATAPSRMWPSDEFYAAKIQEQKDRRERYLSNAYRLEPNLKESNGGLRDIQTVFWITRRHFGTTELEDLMTRDILTPVEFETLLRGMNLLWRIRYLLHRIAGRREDRLLFDYQKELAHEWGFLDDTNNRCIEQIMQLFYRNAMQLERLNEIILQGFGGIISGVTAATDAVPVNTRFQVRNGFLEVTHDRVFINYPPALLEVFLVFGDTPSADRLRSNTVRLLRSHLDLIDKNFREDMVVRSLFLQIFRNPNKLTRKIRMMNRYGVLAAYLPAFDKIVGRMQYDLFHIYTVDEHTTRVIRNLRRFALPEHIDELPHCTHVMTRIDKPELLYLAGLFHDIAKGRDGDHWTLGAVDARGFCELHGLGPADTALVSWLVEHHLALSTTAQRKDISDPEVILEFAQLVSSSKHLDHLYLLTVADIRATNPELWNSFKQSLLQELHRTTRRLLSRGLDNPRDKAEVLAQKKVEAMEALSDSAFSESQINALWDQLGDDYYLQYQAIEIARHSANMLAHEDVTAPLVTLRHASRRGSTEVFVYMADHDNLFALITATLDRLNLNILSANITTTTSGHALDTFYVLDEEGNVVTEATRLEHILAELQTALQDPDELPAMENIRTPRLLKHFDIVPIIEFDNSMSSNLSSLYINAADQPGLLSLVGRTLQQHNVRVFAARIATFGERIEDMFFVKHTDGSQIPPGHARDELAKELAKSLSTSAT